MCVFPKMGVRPVYSGMIGPELIGRRTASVMLNDPVRLDAASEREAFCLTDFKPCVPEAVSYPTAIDALGFSDAL